jgi:DNA-binding GntR family transcriptional regulator
LCCRVIYYGYNIQSVKRYLGVFFFYFSFTSRWGLRRELKQAFGYTLEGFDRTGTRRCDCRFPMTTIDNTSASPIPRQSLSSAVADKLRNQIIRGEIPEGSQLRQDVIAAKYHVSRIPVREALRQLDAEGLITIVPNRGAIIPQLSPNDIEELFAIRALLEPEILKLSIPRLLPADFAEAEAVLNKYVGELQRESHIATWGQLNSQFHSILYSRADRPHFMSIIRNVNHTGERYTRLQLYLTHGVKRANEEHHRILELCRKRDVEAACELLRQHIQYAGQSLKQVLQQNRLMVPPPAAARATRKARR